MPYRSPQAETRVWFAARFTLDGVGVVVEPPEEAGVALPETGTLTDFCRFVSAVTENDRPFRAFTSSVSQLGWPTGQKGNGSSPSSILPIPIASPRKVVWGPVLSDWVSAPVSTAADSTAVVLGFETSELPPLLPALDPACLSVRALCNIWTNRWKRSAASRSEEHTSELQS